MKVIICEGVAARTDLSRVLERATDVRHLRMHELSEGHYEIWVDRLSNRYDRGGKCTWAMGMQVRQTLHGLDYEISFELDNIVVADICCAPVTYLCLWLAIGHYYMIHWRPIPVPYLVALTVLWWPLLALYALFQTAHVLGWRWSKKALLSLLADTESGS